MVTKGSPGGNAPAWNWQANLWMTASWARLKGLIGPVLCRSAVNTPSCIVSVKDPLPLPKVGPQGYACTPEARQLWTALARVQPRYQDCR